jgi:hypothetical protein
LSSARVLYALAICVVVGAILAACGPGASGPFATLPAVIAPTPLPIATQAPFAASQSTVVSLPTAPPTGTPATPIPLPLPSAGGYAPTLDLPLPIAPTSATIAQAVTNTQPSAVDPTIPVLSSGRSVLSTRSAQDANRSVLLFVSLNFSTTITLSGTPAFSFVVPNSVIVPGADYYVAMFDPTNRAAGWQLGFEGPAAISGNTVVFKGSTTPFTLTGGVTYYFALYATSHIAAPPTAAPTAVPTTAPSATASPSATPSAAASPTPAPTATPTATPTPTPTPGNPVPTVTSMAFTQSGTTQTFTVTETNYNGAFTVTSSDATIAAVSPGSGTSATTFTVTAGTNSGSATITMKDANGHTATFVATVTLTTITVSSANMGTWSFINDCGVGSPAGALVSGPANPPMGTGSAQLSVGATSECIMLATTAYSGTALSSLTTMNYSSSQPGPTLAISLQFDVRYHPSDTAYGGRLVFEPYQNGTVTVGSGWQNWNALAGKWWASKTTSAGSNGLCPQSNPCTWTQIQANWPSAAIVGNTLFKAGSGWASFTGNVDAFVIGVGRGNPNTTYDFEP